MTDIEKFIINFRKESLDLIRIFTSGYCYHFALILSSIFNAELFYLPIANHFIAKKYDKYWDITGEVIPDEEPWYWEIYQEIEPLGSERIYKDCIIKEN